MPGKRLWIIAALAWLAHWAAAAVPGVRLGAVTVPGFAAVVDVSLLAALALVIWLMVFGPVRSAARIRAACGTATAPPWTVTR